MVGLVRGEACRKLSVEGVGRVAAMRDKTEILGSNNSNKFMQFLAFIVMFHKDKIWQILVLKVFLNSRHNCG